MPLKARGQTPPVPCFGILVKHPPRQEQRPPTFATEAEAKAFVRAKLDEGLAVFAGTINPSVPRQLIPSTRIQAWLADELPDTERHTGPDTE